MNAIVTAAVYVVGGWLVVLLAKDAWRTWQKIKRDQP